MMPYLYKNHMTCRQAGRQAGRQTGRQAVRQADRQAGRQAGRQMNTVGIANVLISLYYDALSV